MWWLLVPAFFIVPVVFVWFSEKYDPYNPYPEGPYRPVKPKQTHLKMIQGGKK